jgi:hypothetical protein
VDRHEVAGPIKARPIRKSRRLAGALLGVTAIMASAPAAAGPAPAASNAFTDLSGVFCTSSSNCWAVESQGDSNVVRNQVLHRIGGKWQPVKVPSPGGTSKSAVSELFAVRCASAANCGAVGEYRVPGLA